MWNQIYDPLHSPVLSTIAAAVPVITLLVLIASGRVQTSRNCATLRAISRIRACRRG